MEHMGEISKNILWHIYKWEMKLQATNFNHFPFWPGKWLPNGSHTRCLKVVRSVKTLLRYCRFIFAFFFDEKLCPQCCGFSISQACFRQVRNNQATSNALSQKHKYKSCKNQLLKHVWSIINSCHFKRRVPL